MTPPLSLLLTLLTLLPALLAWDPSEGDVPWQPDEIALFELVDELNSTFYELMNISRNATTKEIKDQYKELAMVLHPDKNPDTEDEFRQLAAVYNILKDKKQRSNYERVLTEGLPHWRMPAFYDRQVQVVRHIGLLEGIITLLVLATFIQYGLHWASYLEAKHLGPKAAVKKVKKVKKHEKAATKEAEAASDEEEDGSPKPSVYDTLPFQLYEMCKLIPEVPTYVKDMYVERQKIKEEERKEQEEMEEERKKYEEKKEEKKKAKEATRKRITGES